MGVCLDFFMFNGVGQGWDGLGWAGLGWVELGRAGLGRAGLDWVAAVLLKLWLPLSSWFTAHPVLPPCFYQITHPAAALHKFRAVSPTTEQQCNSTRRAFSPIGQRAFIT